MPEGFMTCMETYMNGVRTGLIENTIPKALQILLQALQQDWPRRCGVATGGVRTGTAGVHHVASVLRTVAAIESVYV